MRTPVSRDLATRWKDRGGRPTIVEASRVHEESVEPIVEGEPPGGEDR